MRIYPSKLVPAVQRPLQKTIDHLARIVDQGIVVDSAEVIATKLPDGRISLSLAPTVRPAPASPPVETAEVCALYSTAHDNGFWEYYDHAPEVDYYWWHFCGRFIEFDFDQSTLVLSNLAARYQPKPEDYDFVGDPIEDFWFVPAGEAVAALLAAAFPDLAPPAGSLHVKIWMEMYREVTRNPAPPPWRLPLGDETSSVPRVVRICYQAL